MKATPLAIPEVALFEPKVFNDERGFFYESFNQSQFEAAIGRGVRFVQDNHSRSRKGLLRDLHYQVQQPQGKLERVTQGGSLHRGGGYSPELAHFRPMGRRAPERQKQASAMGAGRFRPWLRRTLGKRRPLYKTADYYAPTHERCIAWNDAELLIDWPTREAPALPVKDARAPSLSAAETFT